MKIVSKVSLKKEQSKSRAKLKIGKIISGGQTGVDRAALNWAIDADILCGGWCPQGRKAEDGRISDHYPLIEASSWRYSQRTQWNVRDSDGTLILNNSQLTGGTLLTINCCKRLEKPFLVVDLGLNFDPIPVEEWIRENTISVLNVAGPRESSSPGIGDKALSFLRTLKIKD